MIQNTPVLWAVLLHQVFFLSWKNYKIIKKITLYKTVNKIANVLKMNILIPPENRTSSGHPSKTQTNAKITSSSEPIPRGTVCQKL